MVFQHGRFAWYELITTDIADAKAFYAGVLGWGAQDVSTPDLAYSFFTAASDPVGGLIELPQDARKMGAAPRWLGYVSVNDVDAAAKLIARLGGTVYVAPTDSNIGRIAVVADPQTAIVALVKGLKFGQPQPAGLNEPGHVGWHELLAADWEKAFAVYRELFGWQKADAAPDPADAYQLFSAGGQTVGGIFTKLPVEPFPYWLYYFNVGDIDTATERVKAGGGVVFADLHELTDGSWVARCTDPQGAIFALQGKRRDGVARARTGEIGWSSEWSGISSRGRLVRPRG